MGKYRRVLIGLAFLFTAGAVFAGVLATNSPAPDFVRQFHGLRAERRLGFLDGVIETYQFKEDPELVRAAMDKELTTRGWTKGYRMVLCGYGISNDLSAFYNGVTEDLVLTRGYEKGVTCQLAVQREYDWFEKALKKMGLLRYSGFGQY